jgi:hypothetical protein
MACCPCWAPQLRTTCSSCSSMCDAYKGRILASIIASVKHIYKCNCSMYLAPASLAVKHALAQWATLIVVSSSTAVMHGPGQLRDAPWVRVLFTCRPPCRDAIGSTCLLCSENCHVCWSMGCTLLVSAMLSRAQNDVDPPSALHVWRETAVNDNVRPLRLPVIWQPPHIAGT